MVTLKRGGVNVFQQASSGCCAKNLKDPKDDEDDKHYLQRLWWKNIDEHFISENVPQMYNWMR